MGLSCLLQPKWVSSDPFHWVVPEVGQPTHTQVALLEMRKVRQGSPTRQICEAAEGMLSCNLGLNKKNQMRLTTKESTCIPFV